MAKKRKLFSKGLTAPVAVALGVAISMAVMLLGALLMAYLVLKGSISMDALGIAAAVVLAIASALGSWCASILNAEKRFLVTALTALVFFLMLLGITAVFFDGMYSGLCFTALVILAGAGVTLLPKLQKNPRKNKIKIPSYR